MQDERSAAPPMQEYYDKRAREYEAIYDKPERQRELAWLRERLPKLYAGRTVLEIACGTGYWTQYIAPGARRVHACDINESVLEIAADKPIARDRVHFFRADAVSLEGVPPGCDGAFAGFWWSHVKKSGIDQFVANLARRADLSGRADHAGADDGPRGRDGPREGHALRDGARLCRDTRPADRGSRGRRAVWPPACRTAAPARPRSASGPSPRPPRPPHDAASSPAPGPRSGRSPGPPSAARR